MTIIVTDTGFGPDNWAPALGDTAVLDLMPDADLTSVFSTLAGVELIRIHFPSFADGRGFSLAQQLRLNGYQGRLRAFGHVLADQYAMARRCGFDDVEIDDDLASRQPEDQWLSRANWQAHNYQARLRGDLASTL